MNKNENTIEEKRQVILQWKKLYLEALIDELSPKGDVLQVGFENGYAAERIQKFKPASHTIVESDPILFKEALKWSKNHTNVKVLEGAWEVVLPQLGQFDALFFNDYPIQSELGMMNRIHTEEIAKQSTQAKEMLVNLEKQLADLKIRYSDQEISEFYNQIGLHNRTELPRFFSKLKDYGFITEKQFKETLKKYHLEEKSLTMNPSSQQNPSFAFLKDCLKNHMRKGSRFSCFSDDVISKYEDSEFFDLIINDPNVDYFEKVASIKVPNFEKHFNFDEALILIVQKFA